MDIKVFTFLLFVSATSSINIHGQELDTKKRESDHFLEVGLGLNYHGVRDKGTSPLTYKGILPSIHLQYLFSNNKYSWHIDENFHVGYLKTRNYDSNDDNRALSYNNEFSFNTLFNVKNFKSSTLNLGGEFGSIVNIRLNEKFNNANLNYEAMVFLAPSAMFEYRTSWKDGRINIGFFSLKKRDRDFKLQYSMSVPVITTLLRPGFVTISDFVDNNSLPVEKENIRIVSFNRLFVLKSQINLYYILHNNNMLKLNYKLSYFSYNKDYNPVKGFNSAFFLSIVFRFNNND